MLYWLPPNPDKPSFHFNRTLDFNLTRRMMYQKEKKIVKLEGIKINLFPELEREQVILELKSPFTDFVTESLLAKLHLLQNLKYPNIYMHHYVINVLFWLDAWANIFTYVVKGLSYYYVRFPEFRKNNSYFRYEFWNYVPIFFSKQVVTHSKLF